MSVTQTSSTDPSPVTYASRLAGTYPSSSPSRKPSGDQSPSASRRWAYVSTKAPYEAVAFPPVVDRIGLLDPEHPMPLARLEDGILHQPQGTGSEPSR